MPITVKDVLFWVAWSLYTVTGIGCMVLTMMGYSG